MIIIKSIKKNFIYNALYNVLILIIPLVTTPYISRVIGAKNIGIYSYTYSIAAYFGMFILLGLNNYGNRTIAMVRKDKKVLSKTFCSIYTTQLFIGLIIMTLYLLYCIFLSPNKLISYIFIIYIISEIININWLYFGLEEFKLTVTRNTIIKVINTICLFLFVKNKNDIYIYALIYVIGMLISQIVLWPKLKNRVSFIKPKFDDIKQHIIPNLLLFIPVIAISIYTTMDKIMLGWLSDYLEAGFYESAYKLTIIPTMVVSSLGTVMLPRMSSLINNGQEEQAKRYIKISLIVSIFIASPMIFGISAIVNEFVPLFYGDGYEVCKTLIPVLVMSTFFISWANVIRTQYLIPNQMDKIYIKSVLLGACCNLVVNFVLIPNYKSIGAAVGTLIAEAVVCIYQSIMVREKIRINDYFKLSLPFAIFGCVMYLVLAFIKLDINLILLLFLKIIMGIIIYTTLSIIYYFKYLKNKVL